MILLAAVARMNIQTVHNIGSMAPFVSLKKQAEILFRLICCERKNTVPTEKTSRKVRIIRPIIGFFFV